MELGRLLAQAFLNTSSPESSTGQTSLLEDVLLRHGMQPPFEPCGLYMSGNWSFFQPGGRVEREGFHYSTIGGEGARARFVGKGGRVRRVRVMRGGACVHQGHLNWQLPDAEVLHRFGEITPITSLLSGACQSRAPEERCMCVCLRQEDSLHLGFARSQRGYFPAGRVWALRIGPRTGRIRGLVVFHADGCFRDAPREIISYRYRDWRRRAGLLLPFRIEIYNCLHRYALLSIKHQMVTA